MKKLLLKLTTLIIILALTLSFAGCSLFEESTTNPNTNSGNYNNSGAGSTSEEVDTTPENVDTSYKAKFGVYQTRAEKTKAQVASEVKGAVVAIQIKVAVTGGTSLASGSGVIVDMNLTDNDGNVLDQENELYVMTCHHVIDSTGEITICLPDAENDNFNESDYNENYAFTGVIGSSITNNSVTLVGGDEISDIALLKIKVDESKVDLTKIPKVKFPSGDYKMTQGEEVVAIGNPSGTLPQTVSSGIISYINRETLTEVGKQTLIQMDANIFHGSSGGGLFNLYGELIGITNAGRGVQTNSQDEIECYNGINFAIPYTVKNDASTDNGFMDIAEQLLKTKTANNFGYVLRSNKIGTFGFGLGKLTNNDVIITEIQNGSPVSETNLAVGDTIIKFIKGEQSDLSSTSKHISSIEDVDVVIKSLKVGDKVSLEVKSKFGETKQVTMTARPYRFCDTWNYS